MQRRTVPATPRHAKHSDHAALSPEAMLAGPAGAPPGAMPNASTGLVPGATPARSGRQRRGARVLAASAALMLALSACGGDEPPDNGLDGTVPDLSTSSDNGGASDNGGTDNTAASNAGGDSGSDDLAASIPAPDPADYPGMDQNTPEGAEQAFKYYIAVLMWAHQSGDTDLLSTLYSENCESCATLLEQVEDLKAHETFWSEATLDEHQVSHENSDNYDAEVSYLFILGEHTEPAKDSSTSAPVPSVEYVSRGGLNWTGHHWAVADLAMKWGPDAFAQYG
ncbi:DUF6318 family protein [Brachybacterium timonense]|uniref:DUF6318 family protein n=1 Tax=Brachybacterium timonense TaxID=2050896 RepID=UPI000D0BA49B|nr:DUF6318 family protein [Brachybacterium timonense]